ncbi:hypothetical protein M3212_07720 [Alkalihalobacillus oceani]|uniref:hypothetical protein n=1 Tax=Halalkalibacter oceani TaxID=1653776 RepID=UPI0020420C4B|nr:hypothetical protein [Halalkalibacter oceani]MCM3760674.1 hypothetical protein [Halalkalibacter oceani]
MNKRDEEQLSYLKGQLDWSRRQAWLLEQLEMKLRAMRQIAFYALEGDTTATEVEQLQREIEECQQEVRELQKQISPDYVH